MLHSLKKMPNTPNKNKKTRHCLTREQSFYTYLKCRLYGASVSPWPVQLRPSLLLLAPGWFSNGTNIRAHRGICIDDVKLFQYAS